jgi:dicarboxylate transporter 10
MCRFWAYDESKKLLDATGKDAPAWKLAVAGSMGEPIHSVEWGVTLIFWNLAGGIAGFIGNPGGMCLCSVCLHVINLLELEIVMVRLQGDFAKPPEKRFNYKHCFDALFRVSNTRIGSIRACSSAKWAY